MSVILTGYTIKHLIDMWISRSRLGKKSRWFSVIAVEEFISWLDRHQVVLMSAFDYLEEDEPKDAIKKIRVYIRKEKAEKKGKKSG